MWNLIIRASLRNRIVVLTIGGVLLLWGAYTAFQLPVDVFPDLTAPTVTVLVEGHGMAPTEMESLVTFPIEAALNGAAGVRRVRSATAVGAAIIWVEFDWGQDIYRARQTVNEKLTLVTGSLPPTIEPPVLAPISSIMGEILFLAVESDRHSPLDVRTVADVELRRRLLAVPGVSQVTTIGGGQRQYQVIVSPGRLQDYEVTLEEVEEAVRRANENTSAGFHVTGGQEYLIQGIGRPEDISEIGQSVITARGGRPILVEHVGDVVIGKGIQRGEGSYNGRPAVILGIQKQPDANTLELTRRLDRIVDDLQSSLPAGMEIRREIFRQADFIETSVRNLTHALRDGGLLVVIVVVLFLANIRASSITLLSIPLSLVTTILALKMAGATINTMTLGGMAIAIGAIVDDAIIDVENVFRRLRENAQQPPNDRKPALEIVYQASSEIRRSIVFATVIIGLVFVPLFFLGGVEGRLLRPLGFAYLVALFASLGVALTITPVLCYYLLPQARAVRESLDIVAEGPLRAAAELGARPRGLDPGRRRAAAGAGARELLLDGACLPAGVQRGNAQHQRGDDARHEPRGVGPARPRHRAHPPGGPGGDVDRPPNGPGRARRASPGGGVSRDRGEPPDGRSIQAGDAGGDPRAPLPRPRHQRDDRPADLPPDRSHAVRQPCQHRGEDLRR